MARWRAWRPTLALEAAPVLAEPVAGLLDPAHDDSPDARREHWGTLAMDLLRDTEIPTPTILGAYVDRVLA